MTVQQTAEHQATVGNAFEIYLGWSDSTLQVRPGQTALQAPVEASVAIEPAVTRAGAVCARSPMSKAISFTRTVASPPPIGSATSIPVCRAQNTDCARTLSRADLWRRSHRSDLTPLGTRAVGQ